MTLLTVLFVIIGGLVGGGQGGLIAFLIAAAMNLFSYWFSDKLILKRYRASQAGPETRLYKIVAQLVQKAGLPMPNVFIIPEQNPNAFATGYNSNRRPSWSHADSHGCLQSERICGR